MGVPSTENLYGPKMYPDREFRIQFNSIQFRFIGVVKGFSQDVKGIPEDGICVKVGSGIEPEVELLLSVALPLAEYIGMKNVRVATEVSQEFEVYLIMGWP